ncbi:MAG: alcohol dehydrogenase catalytic domain-containing protein [Micromonosporaceae bacterium]|nr:alcohol dehydrogenase catalytic domain-containing protein [Micromonosporaceae bacterium]
MSAPAFTTRAVVKDRPQPGVRVAEVTLRPRATDVVVRPLAIGICGSDVSTYRWGTDRANRMRVSLPVVMGHEIVGEVVEIGPAARTRPGVSGLAVGARIIAEPIVACGRCRTCVDGRTNLCYERRVLGLDVDGGMADLAVLPASSVLPLPVALPPTEATLLEPLATAVQAMAKVGPVAGVSCAVVGPGPLGLLLTQALVTAGATTTVLGTERSRERLRLASTLGAAETVVADAEWTRANGDRFEVVFDVGGPTALLQAVQLVRRGGRVVYASGSDVPVPIAFNSMLKHRGIDLLTSTGHQLDAWMEAFALAASGGVRLAPLIDAVVSLERVADGFAAASARSVLKCVVVP